MSSILYYVDILITILLLESLGSFAHQIRLDAILH